MSRKTHLKFKSITGILYSHIIKQRNNIALTYLVIYYHRYFFSWLNIWRLPDSISLKLHHS